MELEFHQLKYKYSRLRAFREVACARLMASLARHGQLSPALVVEDTGGGGYVLIDGYRRCEALMSLGRDKVTAMVLPMDEKEALLHDYRQRSERGRCALEDGWLIQELYMSHEMSQKEIAVFLQHSVSWVSRRLSMARDLPEKVQEMVRRGQVCGYSAGKYLVPLARVNIDYCLQLAAHARDLNLSSRQLGAVYDAWRTSNREERDAILGRPDLFLEALRESQRSEQPIPEEHEMKQARMLKDLDLLGRLCQGVRRHLKEAFPRGDETILLLDTWKAAYSEFMALSTSMKEVPHA